MVMKNTTLNKQEGFMRAFCQVYSCSKAVEEFLSDRFQATPQSGMLPIRRQIRPSNW